MPKCDSCDIDVSDDAIVVRGKIFCCAGCSKDGPCICSYEHVDGRRQRNGHSDPVISTILFFESQDTFSGPGDQPSAN